MARALLGRLCRTERHRSLNVHLFLGEALFRRARVACNGFNRTVGRSELDIRAVPWIRRWPHGFTVGHFRTSNTLKKQAAFESESEDGERNPQDDTEPSRFSMASLTVGRKRNRSGLIKALMNFHVRIVNEKENCHEMEGISKRVFRSGDELVRELR